MSKTYNEIVKKFQMEAVEKGEMHYQDTLEYKERLENCKTKIDLTCLYVDCMCYDNAWMLKNL